MNLLFALEVANALWEAYSNVSSVVEKTRAKGESKISAEHEEIVRKAVASVPERFNIQEQMQKVLGG